MLNYSDIIAVGLQSPSDEMGKCTNHRTMANYQSYAGLGKCDSGRVRRKYEQSNHPIFVANATKYRFSHGFTRGF